MSRALHELTNSPNCDDRCCFDYGNAEANGFAGAPGTMEALYQLISWLHQCSFIQYLSLTGIRHTIEYDTSTSES